MIIRFCNNELRVLCVTSHDMDVLSSMAGNDLHHFSTVGLVVKDSEDSGISREMGGRQSV